jgi:hypothetical protein
MSVAIGEMTYCGELMYYALNGSDAMPNSGTIGLDITISCNWSLFVNNNVLRRRNNYFLGLLVDQGVLSVIFIVKPVSANGAISDNHDNPNHAEEHANAAA